MNRTAFLIFCVATAALAFPLEEAPLLPGALPATTSLKYLPFSEIGGRIINGSPASIGQFPWQAALYLSRTGGTSFCGGSLISPTWILTAAHCVQGVTGVTAYLGVVSLSDTSRVTATASRAVPHPNYNSQTLANDIALLQLSSSVATSSSVSPVTLDNSYLASEIVVTVSGWGRTSDSSTAISQTLNYVSLTTISNSECAGTYGSIDAGIVCARGNTIESTCNGDSGGPLITGSGSTAIQVGAVSFGHINGCALGFPVGFARISAYRIWITSNSGV